jgi:hypothetical protein
MNIRSSSSQKILRIAALAGMTLIAGDSFFNTAQASQYGDCGGGPYDKQYHIDEGVIGCHGSGNQCKTC